MIAQNALLVRKYRQRPMPQTDASGHSLPIMAINDDLSSHGFHLHAPWAEKMYFCAKSRARRTRCDARNHRMRFVTRKVGAIT